ncbi:MAG: TIGR00730 family Rossman fold protein [Eubacterium sp.]|nr:TIGR00730 family Rossman fold protein [Eubacterium sp.]
MNICVFGAASMVIDKKYLDAVEKMGEHLAKNGHNLVFGSGRTGNMGAAARGFRKGGGKTHGVIPTFFKEDLSDYVDFDCDEMTYTETMRERKAVMEDLADAFIITPGGCGTFEEFYEVLTLKQLGRHRKPIAVYNIDGYYDAMESAMQYSIDEGFIRENCAVLYKVFDSLDGMLDYIENDDMQGLTLHDLK